MKLAQGASAVLVAIAITAPPAHVVAGDPVWPPPTANWAGTTDIRWTTSKDGTPVYPKRVGILAYCADMYHNAGDTGLQAGKIDVRDSGQKRAVQSSVFANPGDNWFLDGPFDLMGLYGAQNVADYFAYDDSINRERDVVVVDASLILPTATQLIQNFDIVVAWTDNKCGQPIPTSIANSAASALSGFAATAGKKLILTGFAFSSSIGFGSAIFGSGLSPLKKGGPGLDLRCSRGTPCPIGSCPATNPNTGLACSIQNNPPQCLDTNNNNCTQYQPLSGPNSDFACDNMLANVGGPTSSSWATALTSASLASGATLCFNYDVPGTPVPFLAINASRNIIAINSFPPDSVDIQKFWYGCLLGNALEFLSGDNRCSTQFCR